MLSAPPKKPAPDECCGGGSCCPCVWDAYRAALAKWHVENDAKLNAEPKNNTDDNPAS